MNTSAAATHRSAFFALLKNPFKFRLFLLQKLPAAYFSGLKLQAVNDESCEVTVPFKWFTRNPFRSTYFACLGMAAEMTTGILAMAHVYGRKPAVSMLVVGVEGRFYKKATGLTRFVCTEGRQIAEAVQKAVDLSAPQTINALSSGYNPEGELLAEFRITWSFRAKQ